MSAKARSSLEWDDKHLTGALWPAKVVVRVLSSITLAVVLLVLVGVYAVLASVPIGLLAQIPTWIAKSALLLGFWIVVAATPTWFVWKAASRRSKRGGFAAALLTTVLLTPVVWFLWVRFAWPVLRFDPASGRGLMFFAEFVERNKSITLRRIRGMEMSEPDFYAWWPLKLVLTLFVLNLVVATLRRIEFTFRNLGVLAVHTGIILIALGAAYYGGLKVEGDTFLSAGPANTVTGRPGDGPPQNVFYDAQRVALFADQGRGWEQRQIPGIPRYNDYGLDAAGRPVGERVSPAAEETPPLRIQLAHSTTGTIDPDLEFAIVGYATYAEGVERWMPTDPALGMPLTKIFLHSSLPSKDGTVSTEPVFEFSLSANAPADRWTSNEVFAIELTAGEGAGMSAARWSDLSSELPTGGRYGLVMEIPATGERRVTSIAEGQTEEIGGYRLTVKRIEDVPSLPIITPGYRGATSSLVVVTVSTPAGETFDRYAYHRFPELDQDLLTSPSAAGMPARRAAAPEIRIGFIDASRLSVYIDQIPGGPTRAIVRQASGAVRITDSVAKSGNTANWIPEIVPKIGLRIGETTTSAAKMLYPMSIPENERTDKDAIGNHQRALVAVEVRSAASDWKLVRWLAFSRYLDPQTGPDLHTIQTPDGRQLRLAFGRVQHAFPGFAVQYVDFEMIAYDFRGSPRDYQSTVRVVPMDRDFEPYVHVARLNAPLRAPVSWNDERPWIVNAANRLLSGLDPRQYKLSQSGWDAQGWQQTQQLADAGQAPGPSVRFTILHVGNNPGIHVVALGAILMCAGIPWAFYVKPWLVQREKRRIQSLVAEGRYKPAARSAVEPTALKPEVTV